MGLNRRIITAVFCAAMVSVLGLPVGTAGATAFTCAGAEATIVGTSGVDELVGTDGPDVIVALGGNDVINAGAGDDIVCAGGGNDVVFGGPGDDTVRGGSGDDRLFGDDGHCVSHVAELDRDSASRALWRSFFVCESAHPGGDDMLTGGNGHDFVFGDEGSDRVFGGLGDDLVFGGHSVHDPLATDHAWGGHGADWFYGQGNNRIFGGEGDDRVSIYELPASTVTVFGGSGDDRHGHYGRCCEPVDVVVRSYGGPGDDWFLASTKGHVTYYGGPGNDTMPPSEGRMGSLRAYGGLGDDVLWAQLQVAGRLLLEGGAGDDFLAMSDGDDATMRGGEGNDQLMGHGLVSGGEGDDQILGIGSGLFRGGTGDDEIIIDQGTATVKGNNGDDAIFEDPAVRNGRKQAVASIDGGPGSDTCNGSDETHCEAKQDEPPFDIEPWVRRWIDGYD